MENRTKKLALEIRDLKYWYLGDWMNKRHVALKGISVDIEEGETFGFLGHNGAGKTTTIKCITGLIKPKSGSINVYGKKSSDIESRRVIGYLPEQPYFYDHLTVTELMEMYACLVEIKKDRRKEAIRRALDTVKVSGKSKSPMRSLSKGLTQRVGLAQAIIADPKLLILDEPFSGLDPIGRKEFRDVFVDLKHRGTTIFISSHILSDVEYLCDRVSIMAHGELKGIFDIASLPSILPGVYELMLEEFHEKDSSIIKLADQSVKEQSSMRLIFGSKERAETALQLAVAAKLKIASYTYHPGALEDLFVKLVKYDEAGGTEKSLEEKRILV